MLLITKVSYHMQAGDHLGAFTYQTILQITIFRVDMCNGGRKYS